MDEQPDFDWDDAKAERNRLKHGVAFTMAMAVFLDETCVDYDVSQPGQGEERRKAVGAIEGLLFAVVYTLRGDTIRIISARRANQKEKALYGPIQAGP